MKTLLTVCLLMSVLLLVDSRPQYSYPVPTKRPTPPPPEVFPCGVYSRTGPAQVSCKRIEVSPGVFQFNCDGADPSKITLCKEHILWLRPPGYDQQRIDIVVPNYQIQELIKAALKASNGGLTNVNILLKKPETVYDVQAQDGGKINNAAPAVNVQYESVKQPVPVHYPVDQSYNPLSRTLTAP